MPNFNDPDLGGVLGDRIRHVAGKAGPVRIMEVCGTHTMAIGRFGIRRLLPDNVHLISGPGCPVCVTPAPYIDNAVSLAREEGLVLATFGDMIRVPGETTSLEKARAEGVPVRVVTTPLDILGFKERVLFLAVGFETTAAPIAATLEMAAQRNLKDVFFYTSLKRIPPTLYVLLRDEETGISGFLLPGHVSAVIGADAYGPLSVPSVIAGFDLLDILKGILTVLEMHIDGKTGVVNAYTRVVKPGGNPKALALMDRCFEPGDDCWRGFGVLPGCSLGIREEYAHLDARHRFRLPGLHDAMPEGCLCGDVLKGVSLPVDCPLFARACTPNDPVGPCMVSSEGSCAACYRYERAAI